MEDNKILENAAMNNEELDSVSGGNLGFTSLDSTVLYAYGLVDDYHGNTHMYFHWDSDSNAVDEGWKKAGITCITKPLNKNKYFLNGKEISRNEAVNHLKANFKQIRDIPKTWD